MPFDSLIYSLFLKIINAENDEVIATLEGYDIDVHACLNKYGWTPLHAAAYKGNTTLVKYLLEKGADKDRHNCSGMSPKMLATEAGHTEVIQLMERDVYEAEFGSSALVL
jgi:ankyrin repeat protein